MASGQWLEKNKIHTNLKIRGKIFGVSSSRKMHASKQMMPKTENLVLCKNLLNLLETIKSVK